MANQLSTRAARMDWSERIGRRVKLRDIHILLAVAKCKSMAKAAEHLAVSQPVVSKVVADLEQRLGVRLLDRDRHGAEPTVYGLALLKRGVAAFDELRQGVEDIEFLRDPTKGELRIGCTDVVIGGLIARVIEQVSEQYPRIKFYVDSTTPVTFADYRGLRERNIELFIGRIPHAIAHEDFDIEVLYDEPILVAAGTNSRWAHRRRIKLVELIDEPWVLPRPESIPGGLIADLFHASGLAVPQRGVVCGSIQMNNSLLATGRFLAIYPGSLLQLSAKRLAIKLLPVELPFHSTPVAVVTLKNRMVSPLAKLFLDCARELAKSLAESLGDEGSAARKGRSASRSR
jgi:DNA-binding transcriptional LysR family regulator